MSATGRRKWNGGGRLVWLTNVVPKEILMRRIAAITSTAALGGLLSVVLPVASVVGSGGVYIN